MSKDRTTAEKFTLVIGGACLFVAGTMIVVPLSTFFGAMAGLIVGLFFGDTIVSVLAAFGIHSVTMWQFGAFMGFIGGFLKTKVTAKVEEAE